MVASRFNGWMITKLINISYLSSEHRPRGRERIVLHRFHRAFPLISAGAYGYPKDKAIKVATDTIRDFLLKHDMLVYLVVFDRSSYAISQKLYANIQAFIDDAYIGPDYERSESLRRVDNIRPYMAQPTAAAPKQKAKEEAKKEERLNFASSFLYAFSPPF